MFIVTEQLRRQRTKARTGFRNRSLPTRSQGSPAACRPHTTQGFWARIHNFLAPGMKRHVRAFNPFGSTFFLFVDWFGACAGGCHAILLLHQNRQTSKGLLLKRLTFFHKQVFQGMILLKLIHCFPLV